MIRNQSQLITFISSVFLCRRGRLMAQTAQSSNEITLLVIKILSQPPDCSQTAACAVVACRAFFICPFWNEMTFWDRLVVLTKIKASKIHARRLDFLKRKLAAEMLQTVEKKQEWKQKDKAVRERGVKGGLQGRGGTTKQRTKVGLSSAKTKPHACPR